MKKMKNVGFVLLYVGYVYSASLPDFLIIGAQKSGTTSLYFDMGEHPRIRLCSHKELHYFDYYIKKGPNWYCNWFAPIKNAGYVAGEATPDYFFTPEAPKQLYAMCPEVKLIVILRNPVDRAISQYKHALRIGLEVPSLKECIHHELEGVQVRHSFLKYPAKHSIFTPHMYERALGHGFLSHGRYAEQLRRWFAFFPREQFLFLSFKEFIKSPQGVLDRVYRFLGLHHYTHKKYLHKNTSSIDVGESLADQEVVAWLEDYFMPYNKELEDLLGFAIQW